ncbi:hypothetical protein [Leptolyngbya ohadii]|uniref:hypothetical protein n=1 Tax=Leptolyngbya ohadii TaxID=1962290 RepID=UPI000B59FFB3|nr:hypothetical protein [Leptolyngbya ohadii]
MQPTEPLSLRERLKAPKAAAIAGIMFSVLLMISIVLILTSIASNPDDVERSFIANKDALLALNLVPFAGIAFLWFIGAVRDRLGEREDQFFATVFLGSGLLFLAMLFASAATAGSLLLLNQEASNPIVASTYHDLGRVVTRVILNTYGIRMAGVFMISICTLFLRSRAVPSWIALLGYGLAALMLLRIGSINRLGWVFMLFPLWILLISAYILIDNYRKKSGITPTET